MAVKIDKSSWSNSSRRSSEYTGQFQSEDGYTESIGYRCKKCFCACVFTPEEQKIAFEVDKKIIHYVPSLCKECRSAYNALINEIKHFQDAWAEDKSAHRYDKDFITSWLRAVREKSTYGKSREWDRETMLVKILREIPSE